MLCRVADSVFWMSRYLERAENTARFIEVTSSISLGYRGHDSTLWSSLLHAGGDTENFLKTGASPTRRNVTQFLLFDRSNPNSVVSCLILARENARTIRENLTTPMWESVNRFYLRVRKAAANSDQVLSQPLPFLEQIKRSAHQVAGVTSASWSRGEAWQFATMGHMLERADKTSRILDVKYYILHPEPAHATASIDVIQWGALLESTSALQMYRRTFGRIEPANVVEFLVLNPRFPRSLRFCVRQAEESLHTISGSPPHGFTNRAEQLLGQLNSQLGFALVSDILSGGLHEFVDSFQRNLNLVGDAVAETFFHLSSTVAEKSATSAAPVISATQVQSTTI